MREVNAAMIVDDDRNLTHVVTSYDTTRYFRQWAEDIMQVRDIEHGLRRIINSSFKNADGVIDEQARQSAVEEITSSNKALRKKFGIALQQYIKAKAAETAKPKKEWIDGAFAELLNGNKASMDGTANKSIEHADVSIQSTATVDQESRITNLLSASQILYERLEAALTYYLTQQATADVKLDESITEGAFTIIYDRNEQIKEFGEPPSQNISSCFSGIDAGSDAKEQLG